MARRFLTNISAPVVEITEAPLFDNEVVNKGYVDGYIDQRGLPAGGDTGWCLKKASPVDFNTYWEPCSLATCIPFFKTDGVSDNIDVSTGFLPFYLSNGNPDPIDLSDC